ncbi:porin [Ottowia sp.]|uniref:porin n=1 Tax=Ottowia sp. TaxID=1898956 RepID=UPI003A835BFE
MKKSLIALAVLGLSGAAMAQSSVTLYGVADAGIGKIEHGNGTLNDGSDKVEFLSASRMNNGNSRLGVRGVEDLGGGLRAGFQFETGLDLDEGSVQGSGGGYWGRHAFMWLGGNWGTVKLGRTLNPTFYSVAAWELTGMANYTIANAYGWGAGGPRNSSQFAYKTPTFFGGLTAEVGYITKHDNADKAKWDMNVIYSSGPLVASVGVNKTKDQKTHYVVGGRYDFGMFRIAGGYAQASQGDLYRRGFMLGGTMTFGAASLTLDFSRDTKNQWSGEKYTNGLIEGKYALSKRTFVYAVYHRYDDTDNYGLGIRHNF